MSAKFDKDNYKLGEDVKMTVTMSSNFRPHFSINYKSLSGKTLNFWPKFSSIGLNVWEGTDTRTLDIYSEGGTWTADNIRYSKTSTDTPYISLSETLTQEEKSIIQKMPSLLVSTGKYTDTNLPEYVTANFIKSNVNKGSNITLAVIVREIDSYPAYISGEVRLVRSEIFSNSEGYIEYKSFKDYNAVKSGDEGFWVISANIEIPLKAVTGKWRLSGLSVCDIANNCTYPQFSNISFIVN